MMSAKLNYNIYDKELFVIIVAFQIWRIYIKRVSEITIFTNYKNLINFCTIKELNWRQVRWLELLLFYKFRIKYRPEKDNDRVDALSRRPDIINSQKNQFHNILCQNKDDSLSPNDSILAATVTIESKMEQRLKKICQKDRIFKILLKKKLEYIILEIKRRLYVSWSLQHWMVRQHHNNSAQEYPRISKTVELLSWNYYFSEIKKKVLGNLELRETKSSETQA